MDEELRRELAAYQSGEGLTPSDLLALPDGLRVLRTIDASTSGSTCHPNLESTEPTGSIQVVEENLRPTVTAVTEAR